jgi:hypothetical protein
MELLREMQSKMDAHHERMMAKMDSHLGETRAWLGEMKACRGVTPACLEEEEPTPQGTEAVAKSQEVPEGATGEETIGAAKDRSRDLRLAVGCRGRLKTRTKRDGRVRQVYAASVGQPTRCFIPAMRKGGLRKGPGKKCRSGTGQKCRRIGMRGPGKTSGNGMREMIGKLRRLLERKKMHSEAIRKSLGMETAKLIAVVSPIGLREPGDWLLWKCRPPPKRKR